MTLISKGLGRLAFLTKRHITHGRLLSSVSSDLTLCEENDGIRVITLNNPKKRNVLCSGMLESLLSRLQDEPSLRCIILRSSGTVFSAGHDLQQMTSGCGRSQHERIFSLCTDVMLGIQRLPVPVIAEVAGLATAAGCQLVASCDIAVASEEARFATPGVSVGLFCSTPGVAVARAVPRKVAMDMLFTAQPISAQEALRSGLVSRVVPQASLQQQTEEIARKICESSKPVNALGKEFFYQQISMNIVDAYTAGGKVMCDNLQLVDGQEGINAFINKRRPVWTHSTSCVNGDQDT